MITLHMKKIKQHKENLHIYTSCTRLQKHRKYRKKMNLLKISRFSNFYQMFPRFFTNKIFQGSQVQTLRQSESAPGKDIQLLKRLIKIVDNKAIWALARALLITMQNTTQNGVKSIVPYKKYFCRGYVPDKEDQLTLHEEI